MRRRQIGDDSILVNHCSISEAGQHGTAGQLQLAHLVADPVNRLSIPWQPIVTTPRSDKTEN